MRTAGLPEWIADGDDEYVAKAAAFAGDVQALRALREGLRERLLRSPMFDGRRFAQGFEGVLAQMWDERKSP